jgi:hypothetical protein
VAGLFFQGLAAQGKGCLSRKARLEGFGRAFSEGWKKPPESFRALENRCGPDGIFAFSLRNMKIPVMKMF